ncbi:MAG TPA: hypothetical protein VD766_13585 [Solirubrobacterales bacterium]|nr:hypothetical protein [Solirubrobacterales bacterium]
MKIMRSTKSPILLLAVVALLAGAPSAANAADCDLSSPTADQYCPPSTTTHEGGNDSGGGLPFTGYDVGLAALVATGLIGAGVGLSRAARTDQST